MSAKNDTRPAPRLTVTARYGFEAAHRLENAACTAAENADKFGMCNRLHGHNYRLEVAVAGASNDPAEMDGAMVVDFGHLDALVEERVLSVVEHQYLNDLPQFRNAPTTAETVAAWVWQALDEELARTGVVLQGIVVYESEKYSAELRRGG